MTVSSLCWQAGECDVALLELTLRRSPLKHWAGQLRWRRDSWMCC